MAKKKKKNIFTRAKVDGQDQYERLENAYQEWKKGKTNSLKELATKYHLHIPDVSKYITNQLLKLKK